MHSIKNVKVDHLLQLLLLKFAPGILPPAANVEKRWSAALLNPPSEVAAAVVIWWSRRTALRKGSLAPG